MLGVYHMTEGHAVLDLVDWSPMRKFVLEHLESGQAVDCTLLHLLVFLKLNFTIFTFYKSGLIWYLFRPKDVLHLFLIKVRMVERKTGLSERVEVLRLLKVTARLVIFLFDPFVRIV